MTRFTILSVVARLCAAAAVSAQTHGTSTTSETPAASGDTRKADEAKAPTDAASPTNGAKNVHENWRSSSGLNNDPNNGDGAPRTGSGLGTSPQR